MNKPEWDAMEKGWQKDMDVHQALFGPERLTEQFIIEEMPHYTTDRNACALVLDEIERREKLWALVDALRQQWGAEHSRGWRGGMLVDTSIIAALFVSPDTICYAALKAVEDARD